MAGTWDEQLHAMDYLIYAYLQTAQDQAAERLVAELRKITRAAPENFKSGYALAAIPARYFLERRRWAEAASLELAPKDFPWANQAWPFALNRFARCLGAARAGNAAAARRELESLNLLRPSEPGAAASYGLRQIDILCAEAKAWTAHAEHRDEEAARWMRQAAEQEEAIEKKPVTPGPLIPARELLAELLLESGQPGQALAEFERSLKESPKRFNGLYGAGCAAAALGESDRAREYFRQLVTICQPADSQRPELLAARQALAQH
jgi:tetratricopeptide (TPR) repeat protein